MFNVFEFCQSDKFLVGGADFAEKDFEFSNSQTLRLRVVAVKDLADAINLREEDKPNLLDMLEERYLSRYRNLYNEIFSAACGKSIQDAKQKQYELSDLLSQSNQIRSLSEKIGAAAKMDVNLVSDYVSEMPYGQLAVVMLLNALLPDDVEFPIVTVMVNAYKEGLLPFGVFTGVLDHSYAGPEVLCCLDPAQL